MSYKYKHGGADWGDEKAEGCEVRLDELNHWLRLANSPPLESSNLNYS